MSEIPIDLILPEMLTDEDLESLDAQGVNLGGFVYALVIPNCVYNKLTAEKDKLLDRLMNGNEANLWFYCEFRGASCTIGVAYDTADRQR